jgi:CMP/dCMP kinase
LKDIVTLSGDIGGGKSSVARILTTALGFQLISAGGLQREIASSMGLTTLQLNELSSADRTVDDKIDSRTRWLGQNSDRIIVDSRLAWHFIPDAYKVFLSVDPKVGAERVFDASRSDENHSSLAHALENNRLRTELEASRFKSLYGITMRDYRNYDLIVDTSYVSPQEVADVIEKGFRAHQENKAFPQVWMSPGRLAGLPKSPAKMLGQKSDVVMLSTQDGAFCVASGDSMIEAAVRDGTSLLPGHLT